MSDKRFILADADSFFTSCERVFNPSLIHKPVVVLSNNDGCVVARSQEVKNMKIPEGIPWFKIREKATQSGIVACSSNYELYASLSTRMMHVMSSFFPNQHIYSIDECFFDVSGSPEDLLSTSKRMREAVWHGLGLPISISIAPTRTLAKIVSHWSKHHHGVRGIMSWQQALSIDPNFLTHVSVSDVWGVGRRLAPKLMSMGINTAADLRDADVTALRKKFGVTMQQTILELRAIACIDLDGGNNALDGKRTTQIMCSRMFSHPISDPAMLRQAINVYTQKVALRLRRQSSLCTSISVFCATSYHHHSGISSHIRGTFHLLEPTHDTLTLTRHAFSCIEDQVIPHAPYARAGVILHGLIDEDSYQPFDTFAPPMDTGIGDVLELARKRFGSYRVGIGYGGIRGLSRLNEDTGAQWTMKRSHLSARATTCWNEMPVVTA